MTTVKTALLLCGSPKPGPSTSRSLLDYLAHELQGQGLEVQVFNLNHVNRDESLMEKILGETDRSDIIVAAFPPYVDGLPFPTLCALERIADHRRAKVMGEGKGFAAICNCVFPEATYNQTALATCEEFAREAGFTWLGGLALCGGPIVGRPLDSLGGMVRNMHEALGGMAKALARGEEIPAESMRLMAKPLVPIWLYRLLGNKGWKKEMKENKVGVKIGHRAY